MNIKKELLKYQDKKYLDFTSKLIPNVDKKNIIGVRLPDIKIIAKKIYLNEDYQKFLDSLPHKYHEENLIHIFIINLIKDYDKCIKEIEKFLPYINNWAVCDSLKPKVLKKNKKDLINFVNKYIKSKHPYSIRYAISILMNHFLEEDYNPKYLKLVSNIKHDDYYVKMMMAWYYSVALVKQYEDTIKYLENKKLDRFVHNTTIQKAIDSYRINDDKKEYLRKLRV